MQEKLVKYLKFYMDSQFLTFEELAPQIGITVQTLRNWINGKVLPSRKSCKQIAQNLNIKFEDLDKSEV